MSIRRTVALAALLHLLTALAHAQMTAPEPQAAVTFMDPVGGVSLEQAIARAVAREPSLRSVRNAVDVARGLRVQAGLRPNPSISFEHRTEPAGTDNQTTVNVQWPLDLFRRDGRIAVADREIAAVEFSIADRERLLAADVRSRYGEVLAAVRDLTLIDELAAAARRQHALLRSRVEEGASPPLERDLVDVELRRLEAERLLQIGRAESAMFALKQSLGMPPDESLSVRDTLEGLVVRESKLDTDASAAGAAADRRPDVREAQSRIGVFDAKVDLAARNGRFDMSVFGGYMRMDAGFPQIGLAPSGAPEPIHGVFHYLAGGAQVTIPLFNRNAGEIAAARAEQNQAAAAFDAVRLSAQTEIASAQARDRRAQDAVRLYSGGARTLARQNLTVVSQSYELGRVTVFEVLAEQKRYIDVERAYTDALRAAFDARTALKRARGDRQ